MKLTKEKLALIAGFVPPCVMLLLELAGLLMGRGLLPANFWGDCILQLALFGLPIGLLIWLCKGCADKVPDRIGSGFTFRALPFILWFSLLVSSLSFLLDLGVSRVFGVTGSGSGIAVAGGMSLWQTVLLSALLPALLEELLFRGGLLSAWEQGGAVSALVLSALTFAMLHGTPANFLGPLAAGALYGYMTLALRSVWPAVLAHFIHNLHWLLMDHLMTAYSTFGIWPYFVAIDLLLLCVFLYFSMASLGKLLEKGRIARFSRVPLSRAVLAVLASPGLWLAAMLYAARLIYP